jgi:hypothetical protein
MITTCAFLKAFDHVICKVKTVLKKRDMASSIPDLCAVISLVQMAAAFAYKLPIPPYMFRFSYCRNMHTFVVEFKYVI